MPTEIAKLEATITELRLALQQERKRHDELLLPKPIVDQRQGPGWSEPFQFRLVSADGKRETNWVGYTQIAYLDGWAVATDYHLGDGTKLEPMRADEMLAATAGGTCTDKLPGDAS